MKTGDFLKTCRMGRWIHS